MAAEVKWRRGMNGEQQRREGGSQLSNISNYNPHSQ